MVDTPPIDPRRTALLVMDYQNGIVSSIDSDAVVEKTAEALAVLRGAGATIGYVRVAFTDEDMAAIPETSAFAAMVTPERRDHLHDDSPSTAIIERLAPEAGDIIVRKTRVGAFSTTDLDEQLRKAGVTTLVLAGLSTSGVVLSTVRDGADRDYRIIVLSDACADRPGGVHEFLTEKIFPRQAHVTTTAELATLIAGSVD